MDLLWARIEGVVAKTMEAIAPYLIFETQRAFSVGAVDCGNCTTCEITLPLFVGVQHAGAALSAAGL